MSDQERIGTGPSAAHLNCPACGHLYRAGDRFCAECGASLPTETETDQTPQSPREQTAGAWTESPLPPAVPLSAQSAPEPAAESEGGLWVLGATPTTVIGGGIVLLLLAIVLLFVGQMDKTGTIVMLSICVTPLALLVLLVGIVRSVTGAAHRG